MNSTRSTVARFVRELIYGQDPIGAARARRMEMYRQAELGGGPLGGLVHYGMKGSPSLSFMGPVASPQNFIGSAQMGKSRGVSVQEYPALPSPTPPPATAQWIHDWTDLEGLVP